MPRTHWSCEKNEIHYRIDICPTSKHITIAEYKGHWKEEKGGSWSLEDFKSGKYDFCVFYGFDEDTLKEVHESIHHFLNGGAV